MAFLDSKYLIKSETAFAIYNNIEKLPIVDPHNHADVAEIARNKKYSDPWQLFAATDHYVWEVMRKRGVEEKFITGDASPKDKWTKLALIFPEVAGNPVYEWIHLDLRRGLGVETLLGPDTADEIWEQLKAVLAVNSKRPQALIEQMNIEVMCSTDDPVDLLEDHERVNRDMKRTVIRPTWRPDKSMNIFAPTWRDYIKKLEARFSTEIKSVAELVEVLQTSHDYFAERGCRASDHGLAKPFSGDKALAPEADKAFKKAIAGEALTQTEIDNYMSYILGELAEMDSKKDWVFQLHVGAVRDVRDTIFKTLGPDAGGDISTSHIDYVTPLTKFLNRFDDRLKVVLYCLDAVHQATLATISRAFGAKVNLGSAWWLNDTPVGMKRQLEYIGSVDLYSNFAGMVSDSRKILSYGSRFEMFRRILADILGTMVDRGQMPYKIAEKLAERMCYSGPRKFFNL